MEIKYPDDFTEEQKHTYRNSFAGMFAQGSKECAVVMNRNENGASGYIEVAEQALGKAAVHLTRKGKFVVCELIFDATNIKDVA